MWLLCVLTPPPFFFKEALDRNKFGTDDKIKETVHIWLQVSAEIFLISRNLDIPEMMTDLVEHGGNSV